MWESDDRGIEAEAIRIFGVRESLCEIGHLVRQMRSDGMNREVCLPRRDCCGEIHRPGLVNHAQQSVFCWRCGDRATRHNRSRRNGRV